MPAGKQTSFLTFQGKDRNKGQGDDSRLINSAGPTSTEASVITFRGWRCQSAHPDADDPTPQAAMRILNHHNGGIHHRTDGNRYPPSDMILAFSPWKCMTIKANTDQAAER